MLTLEIEWKQEWFQNIPSVGYGFWKSPRNQKIFFETLGKELGIKEPKEWGNISSKKIAQHGGEALLKNYFNNSVFKALKSVYPGIPLEKSGYIISLRRAVESRVVC